MPTTPVETQASQQLPRKHSHRLIAGTPRAAKSESEATVGALRGARRGPTASTQPTNQLTAPPVGGRRLDPDRLGDHIDRLYRAARALTASREAAEDLVRRRRARRDDNARPRKVGGMARVGRFVARLASSQHDAAPVESCPAGCTPRP